MSPENSIPPKQFQTTKFSQKHFSSKIEEKILKELLQRKKENETFFSYTKLLKQVDSKVGSWVSIMPSIGLKQNLTNDEFNVLVKFRLNMQLMPNDAACSKCSSVADKYGYHFIECRS